MDCKCPACQEPLEKLVGKKIRVETDQSNQYTTVLCCANCGTLLGCQADPNSLQRQVERAIEDAFIRRGKL